MKAMILAAGLGKRMRPLTEHTPKPLLRVGEKCLIEFHLEQLARAGIKDVVINTHWLAQQIPAQLGNGARWGLNIHYSYESELLETAGGIFQALPLLLDATGADTFLLINGDIYSEFDLKRWVDAVPTLSQKKSAFLAMVKNPDHHLEGDFGIELDTAELSLSEGATYTYAGIGLFHGSFFDGMQRGRAQLGPMLKHRIEEKRVLGEVLDDFWLDVGTPERFADLKARVGG